MELAQLIVDTGVSANWIMAGMMALLIIMIKRAGDRADVREKKIDEILERQQEQIQEHAKLLAIHENRLEGHDDIILRNERVYGEIMLKLGRS